jgi:protein-arginine kinase
MGAGASTDVNEKLKSASPEELAELAKGLSEEGKQKLSAALSGASAKKALTPNEKAEELVALKSKLPDNIAVQTFDMEYYKSLSPELQARFVKCLDSGRENHDSNMGCYANHPDDYETFRPFFEKALEKYHKVDLKVKKHKNDWNFAGVAGLPEDGVLDLSKLGLPALSMRVRTGRNLNKYPLPASMTQADRENMEKDMGKVFEKLISDPAFGGKYVSITPGHPNFIDDKGYKELVDAHIMFKDMAEDPYLNSAGISAHWPHGRGCYISEDKGFIVWVGEEDHLRIMCMQKGHLLNQVFDRLRNVVEIVEKMIDGGCAKHPDFGVVTSCPTNIGTGMRASVHIPLPNLCADGTDKKAKEIAKPLGLSVRGLGGEHTPIGKDGTVDISPSARFCISEAEIVTALYLGLEKLKAAETAAGSA